MSSSMSLIVASTLGLIAPPSMELPVDAKGPSYIVYEISDYAGEKSHAKAKMTYQTAKDWCDNWKPGDDVETCAKETFNPNEEYSATANCKTGELISVNGDTYKFAGLEHKDKDWLGYPVFSDIDGNQAKLSYAGNGLALAAEWRVLCPFGKPYDLQPIKIQMDDDDFTGDTKLAVFNGSTMLIDFEQGLIAYKSPSDGKASPKENSLLFRGLISKAGPVDGVALVFTEGCKPAPYTVSGYLSNGANELDLYGYKPIVKDCKLSGFEDKPEPMKLTIVNH